MTDDKTYNGWKNYETWSIALFIDNEESWYEYISEEARITPEDYDLMEIIKNFVEDNLITSNLTPYQIQMINASLSEVDYREIVKHYREE